MIFMGDGYGSTVSTSSEEKEHYENVPEAVVRSQSTASDPSFGHQLGILIKTALRKSRRRRLSTSGTDSILPEKSLRPENAIF